MTETYEIRIEGHLHSRWFDWFAGFAVTNLETDRRACAEHYATRPSCWRPWAASTT